MKMILMKVVMMMKKVISMKRMGILMAPLEIYWRILVMRKGKETLKKMTKLSIKCEYSVKV
jgi:hypothetical protein